MTALSQAKQVMDPSIVLGTRDVEMKSDLEAQYLAGSPVRITPAWKRGMDILGALTALVLLGPAMAGIAVLIRLTSRGPVIFSQLRSGQGGVPFRIYKFRTMVSDAEVLKKDILHLNERSGPAFKMRNDPRVTVIGRLLRSSSLDELPQFFNVLVGDMSLVGPRPLPVEECRSSQDWHRRRLAVKPGITCIWQVSGRDQSCFDRWMRQDIEYIERQSLRLDIKLLFKTIPAVLSRRGAH